MPILYIIVDYDNTVTYKWDEWNCDNKGIFAIPLEVIPIWIIKLDKIRFAQIAQYLDVNVVICLRISMWSSFRDYFEIFRWKEKKMVIEAFRINIVISRLTESWCLTPSHSRGLCQVETEGIKSQATVSLTENDTWHFVFTTVVTECQQHAQPKHKLSNQKSGSIYLTLKPTFPFSVPTQISSVSVSSFLRPIGLSWRQKGRFSR